MSSEATKGQTPDIYGQVHPIETQDLIQTKLKEFQDHVSQIPDKTALMKALEKCPDQLTDEFKIMFLRAEVFNADLAAKRYVTYWERRLELFGEEKAFQKLSQAEALRDDQTALKIGFQRDLGVADPSGRALIYADPSRLDSSKYPRESMVRALFYTVQKVLESRPDAQKHGVVLVAYPHHAKLGQLDRKLMKTNAAIMKGAMPVRISGIHICNPPAFFQLIYPIIKLLLGERLRKRINLHAGNEGHIHERLSKFGLTKDHLPVDLGGNVVLDHEKWLAELRATE